MKTVKSTLVAACVVLLSILSSCSNDDAPVLVPNSAIKDIYFLVGYEGNVGKYWKNGVATALTDGTKIASANAITVVRNDVYVVGGERNGNGISVAKCWKNGVANLVDPDDAYGTEVYGMAISSK